MIAITLSQASLSVILAADSDGGPLWLLALGPGGAAALYFGLWSYYRNTGKSHSFERETRIVAQPATGNEKNVDVVTGTKEKRIDGDNRTKPRQRVQRVSSSG
jgi:hypothetical protein